MKDKDTTKKLTKKKSNTNKKNNNKEIVINKETGNEPVKVEKKHNGIISFWKFMFCLMIVIFHGRDFVKDKTGVLLLGGSIGVEFFFLVSGYLMTKSALKATEDTNIGKDTVNFILKKLKTFIPYTIICGIIGLILLAVLTTQKKFIYISSIFDILLLKMSGIRCFQINGPVWYISSMLICMAIIYPLLRKYKHNFIYIAAPLIVILGLGYLNHNYGSLRGPSRWLGLTYKGNIRAFVELTLGSIMYLCVEKIKTINFTKFGKLLITLTELGCFILPFLMSQFVKNSNYDYILLFIISFGIILAFSEKTLEYNLFCNKLSYWLEKLSLSLFMIHIPIRLLFIFYKPLASYTYIYKLTMYVSSSLLAGIILMYIMDYLKNKNYFIPKFKKLIIKEK